MSIVLMYHALFPDNDLAAIDREDLPYALSVSEFTRQMDLIASLQVGLYANLSCPDIVVTFDDGHASNLHFAAPVLAARNLSAYFFVTTDFIGQRSGFMSHDELRELSDISGMCIGSHGVTHRFFNDMTPEESARELSASRQFLETLCQTACRSISLPGGRFTDATLLQLRKAGYTQWFGSEIGFVTHDHWEAGNVADRSQTGLSDRWQLSQQRGNSPLARVAIRQNTRLSEFKRIIAPDTFYYRRRRIQSQVKHAARRLIGNRLYHGLYRSIAGR